MQLMIYTTREIINCTRTHMITYTNCDLVRPLLNFSPTGQDHYSKNDKQFGETNNYWQNNKISVINPQWPKCNYNVRQNYVHVLY